MSGSSKYDEIVKTYTPEELQQHKQDAYNYYIENEGNVAVKVLARKAKVPQSYIREWMAEEDWHTQEDRDHKVGLSDKVKEVLKTGAAEYGLNEQEELFCYHYLKTFNCTMSAVKAGYGSSQCHQKGNHLLQNEKIKTFLRYLKGQRNEELFVDSMRVIKEYIKIAFADITDFVSFDAMGVRVKNSKIVDGQMIAKIKDTQNGVSVELVDKLKALEKLEKFLQVMPDDWRKDIEFKKLAILQDKFMGSSEDKDDGLIEALGISAKQVWGNGHSDSDEED